MQTFKPYFIPIASESAGGSGQRVTVTLIKVLSSVLMHLRVPWEPYMQMLIQHQQGKDLRVCLTNKCPGEANAAGRYLW